MTRLLPRLPRRATAETDPAAGPATAPAAEQHAAVSAEGGPLPAAGRAPAPTDASAPGAEPPGPGAARPAAPAGTDPAAAPGPGFRERARLRRRLRFLRRVRELGFRDLGGLVFDQHRFRRPEPGLVTQKVTALAAVDGELRAIEAALGAEQPVTELREAGVSACARCGALIGSDARFCPSCGASVRGAREVVPVADAARGTWTTTDLGGSATQASPPVDRPAPGGPGDPAPGASPGDPAPGAAPPQDPGARP